MTTRRDFLKQAGSAAVSSFAAAKCWRRPVLQTPQPQRLPVMVNGKRIKTIDVHAHCHFHEAVALMGDEASRVLREPRRERTFYCHRRASAKNRFSGDRHGGALHQSVLVSYGSGYGRQDRRGAERETAADRTRALRCFCFAVAAISGPRGTAARDRSDEARIRGAAIGGSVLVVFTPEALRHLAAQARREFSSSCSVATPDPLGGTPRGSSFSRRRRSVHEEKAAIARRQCGALVWHGRVGSISSALVQLIPLGDVSGPVPTVRAAVSPTPVWRRGCGWPRQDDREFVQNFLLVPPAAWRYSPRARATDRPRVGLRPGSSTLGVRDALAADRMHRSCSSCESADRSRCSCCTSGEAAVAGAGTIGTTDAACGANQPSCGDELVRCRARDGSALPCLRVSRRQVRRQHNQVVRIGGHASRSHTLHSMPLLVLLRAAATRGQVLLIDQDGIALFCAGICAQFRLCLHSVRRRARSTSPTETVWPPGYALVVGFFAPRVLSLLAAASAPLPFVVVPLWRRRSACSLCCLCVSRSFSSWHRRCSASLNCSCAWRSAACSDFCASRSSSSSR